MEAVPCPWWARLERILARMDDVRHNNPITERLGGDIQVCLTVSGIPRQPRPACQDTIWSVSLHLQPQPSPLRRLHLFGYSTHPQPSGFRRPPSSRVSRAVDGWSLLAVVTPSRRQRQRHGPGHGSPVRALRRRFVHATAGDNLVKWLVFPLQGGRIVEHLQSRGNGLRLLRTLCCQRGAGAPKPGCSLRPLCRLEDAAHAFCGRPDRQGTPPSTPIWVKPS